MPRTSAPIETHHENELGFRVWQQHGTGMMSHPHTHPDIEVNYLYDGGFSYLHGGAVVPVETDCFTVLWGGIPHQTVAPGIVGQGIWITLPLAWFLQWQLPNALGERLLAGEIVAGAPDPAERVALERWRGDVTSANPAQRRAMLLEMEARFHRLALASPRAPRSRQPRPGDCVAQLAGVTRFIAQHYREPITVQAIADDAGLHPKYLMRVFKKQCGTSVWAYLTRLRVSHAQRLLVTTDLKVLDVAMESGFLSLAPFYAAFAGHSRGLRPLDYRRQHQPAAKP
ncbi:MAG: helix-turn-helix domain-containing protein [Opitutaceae bacterium]|nr:helix-turn-helix domain-containing protein [Opitutaceae bacterium]